MCSYGIRACVFVATCYCSLFFLCVCRCLFVRACLNVVRCYVSSLFVFVFVRVGVCVVFVAVFLLWICFVCHVFSPCVVLCVCYLLLRVRVFRRGVGFFCCVCAFCVCFVVCLLCVCCVWFNRFWCVVLLWGVS